MKFSAIQPSHLQVITTQQKNMVLQMERKVPVVVVVIMISIIQGCVVTDDGETNNNFNPTMITARTYRHYSTVVVFKFREVGITLLLLLKSQLACCAKNDAQH
jgi:hypothetical protein